MEIKQLEYFVAACEKGSFNKAAECLYTSQPNVSKVISGLEKELGRSLFERNSKGIKLTPFGETIEEYAQNILKKYPDDQQYRVCQPRRKAGRCLHFPAICWPSFSLISIKRQMKNTISSIFRGQRKRSRTM